MYGTKVQREASARGCQLTNHILLTAAVARLTDPRSHQDLFCPRGGRAFMTGRPGGIKRHNKKGKQTQSH